MSQRFLDMVVLKTRERIHELKSSNDVSLLRGRAEQVRDKAVRHRFRSALAGKGTNIIAEIKRASPSKGVINGNIDVTEVARSYESGGAAAISVLTESEYFRGSLEDLKNVCDTVGIPVLRKDFIIDEYQIYEAAAAGADAVLLIVAALSEVELATLLHFTLEVLSMDAIVEVHTSEEMEIAKRVEAEIIGVNNRDLRSLEVSIDVSRRLIADCPEGTLMVAESGLTERREIQELQDLGFNAFLIGEVLMRTDDIEIELRNLTTDGIGLI